MTSESKRGKEGASTDFPTQALFSFRGKASERGKVRCSLAKIKRRKEEKARRGRKVDALPSRCPL